MHYVTDALRPYWPLIAAVILWPVVTGVLNWWLWWDTPEHWDAFVARQPRAAFAVRFLRAAGPHLRKLVVAWRDYAASRSALPLASPPRPAPLSVVAEKAGAVAVYDSRPTLAPPAPPPLRAATLTGVGGDDALHASARRFVAQELGEAFDASARQEIPADAVAEARRITGTAHPAQMFTPEFAGTPDPKEPT